MIQAEDMKRISREYKTDGLEQVPAIYHLFDLESRAEKTAKEAKEFFANTDRVVGMVILAFTVVGCIAVVWMGTR